MRYFIAYTSKASSDEENRIESTVVEGPAILTDKNVLDIEHRIRRGLGNAVEPAQVRLIAAQPLSSPLGVQDVMRLADKAAETLELSDAEKLALIKVITGWSETVGQP